MKYIVFYFHFIRKNLFPVLLTLLIYLFTFFYIITLLGKVEYKRYATDRIHASGLEDAVFATPLQDESNFELFPSKLYRDEVERMSGVLETLSFRFSTTEYAGYPVNAFYYPDSMIDHFKQKVKQGRWLGCDSNTLEAVVGGVIWPDVQVGDNIRLENGISCKVVGILSDLAVFPAFSRYSSSTYPAEYLFKAIDNVVFLNECAVDYSCFDENSYIREPANFFVEFSDAASSSDKTMVLEYLQNIGVVWTIEEIIECSDEIFKAWIKEQFPLPVFLVVIATINTVSICVVILHRSLSDISKYYLLGCTRRYIVTNFTIGMGIVFSIPAVINIILALLAPNFLRYRINNHIFDYLIDVRCVIPITVHIFITLVIIGMMTYLNFRKYSPFDFYRRNL